MNRQQVSKIMKKCKSVKKGWIINPDVPDIFRYNDIDIEMSYDNKFNIISIKCLELHITDKDTLLNPELWQKELAEFLIDKNIF